MLNVGGRIQYLFGDFALLVVLRFPLHFVFGGSKSGPEWCGCQACSLGWPVSTDLLLCGAMFFKERTLSLQVPQLPQEDTVSSHMHQRPCPFSCFLGGPVPPTPKQRQKLPLQVAGRPRVNSGGQVVSCLHRSGQSFGVQKVTDSRCQPLAG